MKKTKIISTVGPASFSKQTIRQLIKGGTNGARINTAYGSLDLYRSITDTVRRIADIPVIFDIKGPEIRIKIAKNKTICKGEIFEAGFDGGDVCFNHNFYNDVSVNDALLIDNGKIRTRIVERKRQKIMLQALNDGTIEDGKGVNIPNKHLSVPTLSAKDLEVVKLAKELEVEYIALSFTRSAADIEVLSQTQQYQGGIIAKIENFEGVQNSKEILEAATGLMVARGDLGVEIEPEKVPLVQKSLVKMCNQRGKIVITATEMLESMVHQPSPTRAEVSDVANAILDGSDAVMLSGETAIGEYPINAVKMMSRIAYEAEKAVEGHVSDTGFINISDTVSRAIQRICQVMPVQKVVTLTRSGYTARMIARFKINQPIIAVTPGAMVKKQLELTFGVQPVQYDYLQEKDRISAVVRRLCEIRLLNDEETILVTAGVRTSMKHASNSIEIHKVNELRTYSAS